MAFLCCKLMVITNPEGFLDKLCTLHVFQGEPNGRNKGEANKALLCYRFREGRQSKGENE